MQPVQAIVGAGIKKVGEKIQLSGIKPRDAAIKEGFNIDNVFKYNLDGSLKQSAKKLDDKFAQLSKELKDNITDPAAKDVRVDLVDALVKSWNKMAGSPEELAKRGGKISDLKAAFDKILNDIDQLTPSGEIGLEAANNYKRAIGHMGAWKTPNPTAETRAMKEVANNIYLTLRDQIEQAAPSGSDIARINKEISDIIPIERAVLDRIPVAERSDLISLSDAYNLASAAATGPKGIAFAVINKLSKLPSVGSKLYRGGEKLQGTIGTLPRRYLGKDEETKNKVKKIPSTILKGKKK